jgi:glutamate carboxypeptidase
LRRLRENKFRALRTSDRDVEITVTGGLNRPPYRRDAGIDALFSKAATIYRRMGLELESDGMAGGGSDGNFTAALGIPTLDGLGIAGDGAHTNHEYLLHSSIDPGTRLMQGLMETLGA